MENCKVILNNDYLFYHKADCTNPYNPFMSIPVAKNKAIPDYYTGHLIKPIRKYSIVDIKSPKNIKFASYQNLIR